LAFKGLIMILDGGNGPGYLSRYSD